MTVPASTFEITVRYDAELREQIEKGAPDPLGWIDGIRVGDQSLVGGENKKGDESIRNEPVRRDTEDYFE